MDWELVDQTHFLHGDYVSKQNPIRGKSLYIWDMWLFSSHYVREALMSLKLISYTLITSASKI